MTDPRLELARLIQEAGLTQAAAAAIIRAQTGERLADVTLRRWLMTPDTPSALPCRPWAVAALKAGLAKHKRRRRK